MNDPYNQLNEALTNGRLAHAYILHGNPYGQAAGIAMKMAQRLMCTGLEPRPCGECSGCRRVSKKSHPDVHWIEPAGAMRLIVVELMKGLIDVAGYTTFEGGWRVGIILCSERFNEAAANKFLKTLEEPPPKTLFLLISKSPEAHLPTIVSRCQVLRVNELLFGVEPTKEWGQLTLAVLRQGFPVTEQEVLFATQAFAGIFDEAKRSMIREITKELKQDEQQYLDKAVIDARASSEARGLWRDLCQIIQLWYRDLLILQAGASENLLYFKDEIDVLRHQLASPNVTSGRLRRVTAALDDAINMMERNLPPLTAFESCLSRLT